MGPGQGLGLRRYHRARSLESIRCAARDPDLRHLEPVPQRGRTRSRARGDRSGRNLLWRKRAGVRLSFTMRIFPLAALAGLGVAAVTAVPAHAGTVSMSELKACAAISAPMDRLACYDSLAGLATPKP